MMTAEQLKNSILQLAMQGKLVEQRPEEGTGEELYRIIKNEKRSIILSGALKGRKTKPSLNIELIEKPYDIPNTWKWIRLRDVAEVFGRIGFRGYQKKDIVDVGKGAITLSPSNFDQNGSFQYDNCTYISWEKYEESPEIKISNGDILIVKTGSSYGKCGIVTQLPEKATINPQLAVLKYILCDPLFLTYTLMGPFSKAQFEGFVIGTSIPTFSQEKLGNLILALPPLEEQKRIVAKIEELMPFVEQYAAASAKLNTLNATFPEMMKKSILQEAVQGKLVPQDPNDESASLLLKKIVEEKKRLIKEGKIKKQKPLPEITEDEIPFEIPDSWEWIRMGELITYQNGYAYKSSDMTDHGFPVIKSGNLMTLQVVIKPNNDYIANPTEKMLDSKIVKGDMLMCLSSQSNNPEPLGKTAIYSFDEPALLNQRVLKMRPIDERLTAYLYYAINSEYFHYTVSHQGGGSAQANLKLEHVLNMLIPVPPIKEQERIVVQLQKVFPNLSVLKQQIV